MEQTQSDLYKKSNCKFIPTWGNTLAHIDDLDYDPSEKLGNSYTAVTKANEKAGVRGLAKTPTSGEIQKLDLTQEDDLLKQAAEYEPSLSDFGFEECEVNKDYDKLF